MAAFNKFNSFIEAVFEKKHDFSADTLKWALTNTAPTAANSVLANITQVENGNGYPGSNTQTISASSQTGGVYSAFMSGNVTFTAAGGTIGPFRYAVIYNDSATNDELVGFYDYGSAVTLQIGESLTINSNGVTLITGS